VQDAQDGCRKETGACIAAGEGRRRAITTQSAWRVCRARARESTAGRSGDVGGDSGIGASCVGCVSVRRETRSAQVLAGRERASERWATSGGHALALGLRAALGPRCILRTPARRFTIHDSRLRPSHTSTHTRDQNPDQPCVHRGGAAMTDCYRTCNYSQSWL
jgi:hypothetical protein